MFRAWCGTQKEWKVANDHALSPPSGQSINDHIPKEQCSLQYSSVDDSVKILTALGKGALMTKVDLKSAFRVIPVHSTDWWACHGGMPFT